MLWQFVLKNPHFGILCQEKSGNPGMAEGRRECVKNDTRVIQGDQIGRIFALLGDCLLWEVT
jgi:hypothetical protein